MRKPPVYIGVAWPYANGGLHLGHVAGSLLPPDIFRRYKRMAGHDVLMVSGSDCHGTPILLKAEAEGVTPAQIVDRYHAEHVRALHRLGIGFDLFTRTTTENHRERMQEIFTAVQDGGFIESRTQKAPYDAVAERFLPDRYVEGTCPHCGYEDARGDQCDDCGKTLDPNELKDPRSKLDPDHPIEFRDTDHFFFLLSKLQPALQAYVAASTDHWRPNTINFTQNWLREGLKDRAITRDLTWGVPIPLEGYEDKRIYVWFEAVCGYLTASMEWARRSAEGDWSDLVEGAHIDSAPPAQGSDAWKHWWTDPDTRAYYFLGKDNIPFHTIIWPGILTALNQARTAAGEEPLVLPYDVPANEFLNLSGQQFSKSRGVTIDVHDVLDRFQADAVRYYLAVNMPEQRDTDWTWEDFLAKVNDELVGTVGNLAHRILTFAQKKLGEVPPVPSGSDLDRDIVAEIQACGTDMAAHLDQVRLKRGIRRLVEFAVYGNQTMQEVAPWKRLKEDPDAARGDLYSLLRIVKALALYMAPYMPEAAQKAWTALGEPGDVQDAAWDDAVAPLQTGATLAIPRALFVKLDPGDIPGADATAADASAADGTGPHASPSPSTADRASKQTANDTPKETPMDDTITFDDFQKIKLRLATIRSVEDHPDADRLYVLQLDVGDLGERQVVAGLKGHYDPKDLEGQTVAFVANLQPAMLRGVESQGMILAADHDGTVAVLGPQRALPPGATIR